ncbi:hypothetical protein BsWGS_13594 [Bradybaena similaris]
MNFKDKLEEDIVKILVVGDASVGKSSFIQRYVNNCFIEEYKCTIGLDFVTKIVERHGGRQTRHRLQFWDIAGQERYTMLSRAYYRYARGCIIMFDLSDPASFQNVQKWKKAVDSTTLDDNAAPVPCLLVANKLDLATRAVTYAQIEELCKNHSFVQWTETSVKDGTNVNEAVTYLLDVILDRSPSVYEPSEYELVDPVHLINEEYKLERKPCKTC